MATRESARPKNLAANVAAAGLVGLAAYAVSTYLATENKESWPPAHNLSPLQETLVRPRTRARERVETHPKTTNADVDDDDAARASLNSHSPSH